MTITQDVSAPLFVVVGSTGLQGTSVINELRSDAAAYRVRAVTRDPSKDEAKERAAWGCEVVAANINNPTDLERAFTDASYVFGMTIFGPQEVAQGINQVNAAKHVGAKTFIWGSLPSLAESSHGKYTYALHTDNKDKVTLHARSIASANFRVIVVQVGYYVDNFYTLLAPRKQPDGTYVFLHALDVDVALPLPFIDVLADLGAYVLGAINNGTIDTVLAAPAYSSIQDQINALSKVAGEGKVTPEKVSYEALYEMFKSVRGEFLAKLLADMVFGLAEFGYYPQADLKPSNDILTRPVRSLEEAIVARTETLLTAWA